jgi:uncharacterized protein (TIGR00725 family)
MKKIIGIMWPWCEATESDLRNAFKIWEFSASQWFIVLTWGRNEGVMHSALEWAKSKWWTTVWILPSDDRSTFSEFIDIPIITNMRSGRNYINILSSDIVIACGMNHWTSSEVSLAIKPWKQIILVWTSEITNNFYKELAPKQIYIAVNSNEAICMIKTIIENEI